MNALVVAVVLAVLSAVGYALAAVTQQRVAERGQAALKTPLWWLSITLNGGAAALHVVALKYGSLAVVQPLGALTLVFALPAGAVLAGRRVTAREWRGAAVTLGGLGALLLVVDTGTPVNGLSDGAIGVLGAVTALTITVLARGGTGPFRGLRLAAASGIAFGVGSVLSQTVMLRLTDPAAGIAGTVLAGSAVVALSVVGLMLSQAAYRFGLGAPLATLTIVNPALSAGVGVVLLHQSLSMTAALVAVPAALLAVRGVLLLAAPEGLPVAAVPARTPVTGPRVVAVVGAAAFNRSTESGLHPSRSGGRPSGRRAVAHRFARVGTGPRPVPPARRAGSPVRTTGEAGPAPGSVGQRGRGRKGRIG